MTNDDRILEEEKAKKIAEIKAYAYKLLLKSDWYLIRAFDGSEDVPLDVMTSRDDIRKASQVAETAINACDTLIKLDQCQWMSFFKE